MNVVVKVSSPVNPTENLEKVKTAITNIFPIELNMEVMKDMEDAEDFGMRGLYGEGDLESLRMLHRRLREECILDTARHIMHDGISRNSTRFRLNKQVAFVNRVNFPAAEESLGSISIEIEASAKDDMLKIIDWLAPHTIDGKPVEEIEL